MRLMLWLIAVVAVFYGGYWVVSSRAVLTGTKAALIDLKAEGRGDFGEVGISGFPSRFDLHVETPSLQSADGLVRWQAPFLQLYALSYKPNHIIAVFPSAQTVTLGTETLDISSDDARASVVLGMGTDLPLDHAQMVAEAVGIGSDMDWQANLSVVRLAIRRDKATENAQEIGLEVLGVDLSGNSSDLMATAGPIPTVIDRVRLDAVLNLNGPINRFWPQNNLRIRAADIRALELDWGKARLRGDGTLTINAAGQPEGRIALRITHWRDVLAAAIGLGLLRAEYAVTVETALAQLALASGDADVLELPVVFAKGRVRLGPFPLGPAPQF